MTRKEDAEWRNRPVQAPTQADDPTYPGDDATKFTHPAFGQIVANRVHGGAVLYGSDFRHQGYVSITIKRSELKRSLNRDWAHGREELISVDLSEAQWARFVSAMNIGDGTQCTIDHIDRQQMPGLPLPVDRRAQFAGESAATAQRVLDELKALRADIEASGLPVKRQKTLLDRVHQAAMAAGSSQDWVAKSFAEHMENTTQKAAIEINAMVTDAVRNVGLDAIRDRGITAPFMGVAGAIDMTPTTPGDSNGSTDR